MAFDYQGARKEGYTDAEIVRHLAPNAKFDVEGALKEGYKAEEIVAHLGGQAATKSTGVLDAARQGAADLFSGGGETAEQFIGEGAVSRALKGAGEAVAPSNYERGRLYSDKEGFTPSSIPQVIAENAPQIGAAIGAYKAGSRIHPIAGLLAATGVGMGIGAGRKVKENAETRTGTPGAEPTSEDRMRALVTSGAEGALGALGAARLAAPGIVRGVGTKGIGEAVKKGAATLGIEGGLNAGQEVVSEVGRTIGTDGGTQLPSSENLINAGLTGVAAASPWAGGRVAKDSVEAVRNRDVDTAAATEVSNRLAQAVGGIDKLDSTKSAAEAVKAVSSDLSREMSTAVKDARARGELAEDTQLDNALVRVGRGDKLTKNDVDAISAVPDNIKSLAQQVTTLAKIKERNKGTADNFKGGVAARMEKGVRAIAYPTTAATALGLHFIGLPTGAAMFGTTAAPAVGAIGGAYLGARYLDSITGARNPVRSFARKFADGNSPSSTVARPSAPVGDEPVPTGPWNRPPMPQVGAFGKGPRPPEPGPQPWGPWNQPPAPQVGTFGKGPRPPEPPPFEEPVNPRSEIMIEEGIRKIAKQIEKERNTQVSMAERALRKLAKKNKGALDESTLPAFLGERGATDIPAFLPKRDAAPVRDQSTPEAALPEASAPVRDQSLPIQDWAQLAPVRARAKLAAIAPEEPATITEAQPKVKATKAKAKAQPKNVDTAKAEPVKSDDLDLPAFLDRRNKPTKEPVQPKADAAKTEPKGPYVPDASKIKFKTVKGDENFPFHDKHDLDPAAAAKAIGDNFGDDHPYMSRGREAFEKGVAARIEAKYKLADALAEALPKIPLAKIRSQLLTIADAKKAAEYRAHLLTQAKTKLAKAQVVSAFNEEAIAAAWKRKRK